MKANAGKDIQIPDNRYLLIGMGSLAGLLILLIRLWYTQIYQGEHYQQISENNRIRRIDIPAPRGMIYDRNGQVLLSNRPFFDLVYVPQYGKDPNVTLQVLSRLLHVPLDFFEKRMTLAEGGPKFLPINLKRNLTVHETAIIESNKIFLPGIDISVVPRRDYQPDSSAHLLGYLGEVDAKTLADLNNKDPENPYYPGDLIGKYGLESRWESYLRGQRGYQLIQVDAFGRKNHLNEENALNLPSKPAVKGADLILTLDAELQSVAIEAFKGKSGAVIALKPDSGQILAMVSAPGFDPIIYQQGITPEMWRTLTSNPLNPLLDKTTGGEFPPGSVYKAIVALAALQERVITPHTTHYCGGSFTLGTKVYHCHDRKGHGTVNLRDALVRSCDVFFYHVGVDTGVDRIAKYAAAFGLGSKLGVEHNLERAGLVPTTAWKKSATGNPWTLGETPNIAIGQGYDLVTPMQMVSAYAAIANGGYLWQPFLVDRAVNNIGEVIYQKKPQLIRKIDIINTENFDIVRDDLREVVMSPAGTGKNARVPGQEVAGKTGSVQVVSLQKNRNQVNVSIKWKEHAMFAAFSPVKNAEIAVAIVSEHDAVGGGGQSAAPVAGEILKAYWRLKDARMNGQMQLGRKDSP